MTDLTLDEAIDELGAGPFATPDEVLGVLLDRCNFSREEILGPDRHYPLVHFRHLAMAAARIGSARSFPDLGRFFDRDHTTVLYAYQKVIRHSRARQVANEIASEARQRHASANQQELFA